MAAGGVTMDDDGLCCEALTIYTRAFFGGHDPPPSDLWCVVLRKDGEEVRTLCSLALFPSFIDGLFPRSVTVHGGNDEDMTPLTAMIERALASNVVH